MTALKFLQTLPFVPMTMKGNLPIVASGSERRRWLQSRSVRINGNFPQPEEEIEFPLTDLVFFPKSVRRCTMWGRFDPPTNV